MITFAIGLFIGAFIGFILAAILAMSKGFDEFTRINYDQKPFTDESRLLSAEVSCLVFGSDLDNHSWGLSGGGISIRRNKRPWRLPMSKLKLNISALRY